jgi:allantoinase
MNLVVRGTRVVLPAGTRPAAIVITDGRIAEVAAFDAAPRGVRLIEAGDLVVLPGLVDTHVHVNDPGRAEWEGFEHATRAAGAGGITTIVDMPLNSLPPTTSPEGLQAKLTAARGRLYCDVGFWGGIVPGNCAALPRLAGAGVLGFKCFLAPSGADEFPHVAEADLREALPVLHGLALPLLVHAELPGHLREIDPQADPRTYRAWLDSRPAEAERAAIDLLIDLAREFGVPIHVVHLSTADALPSLAQARAERVPISVETCPHYLTFAAEEIGDGLTAYKCAPPIRSATNRERLWGALLDGVIDLVATDHSPAPPALKHIDDGDFARAWGGIASLQLSLPVTWTGARRRTIGFEALARWMSSGPARLAGLDGSKGSLDPGKDGDLVIWDPDEEWTVDPMSLQHRHAVSPYAGMRVRGRVHTTVVRGTVVYDRETLAAPCGMPLTGSACGDAKIRRR